MEVRDSPKFSMGRIVATKTALHKIHESNQTPEEFLFKHERLNQGLLCKEDQLLNIQSLESDSRILSYYETHQGVKLYIITDAVNDYGFRLSTTILLAEEY